MGSKASLFAPLGDIFMQLIKMVVIPLVATSIITGAASIGNSKYAGKGGMPEFWQTIKEIIPTNPFESLVKGNILSILFFSLFFGFGIASLKDELKDTVISFFSGVTDALAACSVIVDGIGNSK